MVVDRDDALLHDMLGSGEEAVRIVAGLSYERFIADRIRVLALERALEVVGEAARNVSPEKKVEITEIPWKFIDGQRNVLAHMYGKVDHFQLFKTAGEDVPRLIAILRKVLA